MKKKPPIEGRTFRCLFCGCRWIEMVPADDAFGPDTMKKLHPGICPSCAGQRAVEASARQTQVDKLVDFIEQEEEGESIE